MNRLATLARPAKPLQLNLWLDSVFGEERIRGFVESGRLRCGVVS